MGARVEPGDSRKEPIAVEALDPSDERARQDCACARKMGDFRDSICNQRDQDGEQDEAVAAKDQARPGRLRGRITQSQGAGIGEEADQERARQGLLDKHPRLTWARETQTLFRAALHLGKRRETLTARGHERQVTLLDKRLDRLLARQVSGVGTNLLDRYPKPTGHTCWSSCIAPMCRRTIMPANAPCARRWSTAK